MMLEPKYWDELQDRFFAGEVLSPEEEQVRRHPHQALGQRELELLEAWRGDLDAARQLPSELVSQVLKNRQGQSRSPHLRLVGDLELPQASPPAARPRRALVAAMVGSGLAATAAAWALWQARSAEEPGVLAGPPATVRVPLARAELVFATGEVACSGKPAAVGERTLSQGEKIETQRGQACVRLDPAIDVCLAPSTSLELSSLSSERLELRVLGGRAVASLAPRAKGHTFSLASGDLVATATGTVFAVELQAGHVAVSVVEGSVNVQSQRRAPLAVNAHDRLTRHASGASERSALNRAEEGALLGLLAAAPWWQPAQLGVLEVPAAPGFSEIQLDDGATALLPLLTFVPAGKHQLSLRGPSQAAASLQLEVAPGGRHRIDPLDLAVPVPPTVAAEPSTALTSAELLTAARRELERGNRAGALALYAKLRTAHPTSPEAATVLVTMGRLELAAGGSPARGLRHFEAYLKLGGPLSQEALAGKIEALKVLGETAEERAAIERYLARYPKGFDAGKLRQRLERLSR